MRNNIVSIQQLNKNFGSVQALKDINLDIYEGEVFGLLGPNGAGKSTLINLICKLTKPTSGHVLLKGKHHSESTMRLGICPQENTCWPLLTCYQQLAFMAGLYGLSGKQVDARISDILQTLDLTPYKNRQARYLSVGVKRRLCIAMAIAHEPELAVFDEPMTGLDPQSRVLVREFIQSYSKKNTVIVSTHNMDEADKIADRLGILNKGQLLIADTPANLKKTVGEGDVIEIKIGNNSDLIKHELVKSLPQHVFISLHHDDIITIKANGLVNFIPLISTQITANSGIIKSFELRSNSLEDVFIFLTGRSL